MALIPLEISDLERDSRNRMRASGPICEWSDCLVSKVAAVAEVAEDQIYSGKTLQSDVRKAKEKQVMELGGDDKLKMQIGEENMYAEHIGKDHPREDVLEVVEHNEGEWLMNMITEHHLCPFRSWFQCFKEEDGCVIVDRLHSEKIEGLGQVCFQICDGSKLILQDVKFIPKVSTSYLSFHALCRQGYNVNFSGSCIKVSDGNLMYIEGTMKHGIGVFHEKVLNDQKSKVDGKSVREMIDSSCSEDTMRELKGENQFHEGFVDCSCEEHKIEELSGGDQFQGRFCWKQISELECTAVEESYILKFINGDEGIQNRGRQQRGFGFNCLKISGWTQRGFGLTLLGRNGLQYPYCVLQNFIFDPGGLVIQSSFEQCLECSTKHRIHSTMEQAHLNCIYRKYGSGGDLFKI